MKSAYFQILVLCVLFIGFPLIQAQGADTDTISTDGYQNDAAGYPDGDQYGAGDEMGEEAALQAQRLMLFGCYFFTKNMLFTNGEQLQSLIENHPNKEIVDKKIISDFMYDCVAKASPYDLQELVTNYGEQNFDAEKWSHLHSFSVEKYQNMADLDKLTDTDLVPFRYFVEIDQTVRQHMEQLQQQHGGADTNEPDVKIWGISLNTVAYYMKFVFAASFVGLLVTAVYNKFAGKEEANQKPAKTEKTPKDKEEKTEKAAGAEKKTEKKAEKKTEKKSEDVKEKDAKTKKDE